MKVKKMVSLRDVLVLTMIFLASHAPLLAAPPSGEVKTVAPTIGKSSKVKSQLLSTYQGKNA